MRLFVALNLPSALQERVAREVLEPLRRDLPGVRWVRLDALHLTLLFLGDRDKAGQEAANTALGEVAAGHAPFTVSLTGLGAFPDAAHPRVLWLGVADAAPLHGLHRALGHEHLRLGVTPETRPYRPHLTLGRVPPEATATVGRLWPSLEPLAFEAEVRFGSLELMRSTLTPHGARYTVLASFALGGGEPRVEVP